MARRITDVLVIGAGAAGLAAARDISQSGRTATVIEARPRIGGRVLTVHDPASPLPIELGAEFIHGRSPEIFSIVRAAGLLVNELPDSHYRSHGGKFSSLHDFWEKMGSIRSDVSRKAARKHADFSFADYLQKTKLTPELKRAFINFIEGYHAAHPEKISALSVVEGDEEEEDEYQQFRLVHGYDGVMHWLRAGLDPERCDVHLNCIASKLRWKEGSVVCECSNGAGAELEPFHARAAVITIPHAVLKAKGLAFLPELPEQSRAAERLEVGQVFKIVLRFRESFWEEKDFVKQRLERGRAEPAVLNFVHAQETDVPVWWTSQPSRGPFLTGWAGGAKAESLLNDSELSQVDRSLASLSRAFAVPRKLIDDLLDSWSMHDWRADPFSRGAYMYIPVGQLAARKVLGKPAGRTLFFAGEATDSKEMGTVGGAIASGRRATREVLQRLR